MYYYLLFPHFYKSTGFTVSFWRNGSISFIISSFLVRREGKTKYFIKSKERIKDYGLEQLFKDKGRIRFSSVEDCKLFLVYCCGCGKTVEYHQEEDRRYFKCRVSDFCPFKVNIVKVEGTSKKKQGKVMYRLVGCKNHIHTVE